MLHTETAPQAERPPGALGAAKGLDLGIDGLLAYYRQIGAEEQRFVLLRQVVLPWMPLLKRHVPEAATRYLDELGGYAEVLADEKLVAELADLREDLDQVNPVQRRYWLFDPTG